MKKELTERSFGNCEICAQQTCSEEYTVSPYNDELPEHQVAMCSSCVSHLNDPSGDYFRSHLGGSIWNPVPPVQALSYRLLHRFAAESWAADIISSIDPEEEIVQWALNDNGSPDVHKDAFGNVLNIGDTVVLTQALDVKGTSFTASKGTVVKKIRLVHDNPEQIEGKINDQGIVILTKYTKLQK